MQRKRLTGMVLAGTCAGVVNGLFGAGGGMVLVPLLTLCTRLQDDEIFPASISIILPICLVSLAATAMTGAVPWQQAVPYLAGGALGGLAAGIFGRSIPVKWLHRSLGIMIIWGGIRYLCR